MFLRISRKKAQRGFLQFSRLCETSPLLANKKVFKKWCLWEIIIISSPRNCWSKAPLIFINKYNKIKINNRRLCKDVNMVLTNGKFICFSIAAKIAAKLNRAVHHICQLISVIKYSISGALRRQSLTRFIRCTTWTRITHVQGWRAPRLQRKIGIQFNYSTSRDQ